MRQILCICRYYLYLIYNILHSIIFHVAKPAMSTTVLRNTVLHKTYLDVNR